MKAHHTDLSGTREPGVDGTLFRRFCELAEEGVWLVDAQTRTTFANSKLAKMLGWEVTAMMGRPLADFMAPEEQCALPEIVAHLQRGITKFTEKVEFRLRRSDGRPLCVRVPTQPILDDGGACAGASAILSDITTRRQAEAELQEAHTFLQATIDGISAHLCVLDEKGSIVSVNQVWRRFASAKGGDLAHCAGGMNYVDVCERAALDPAVDSADTAAGAVLAANPAASAMLRLPAAEICRRGRAGLTVAGDLRLKAWLRKRARNGMAQGDVTLQRGDGSRFEAALSSSIYPLTPPAANTPAS